ncbi:MAG: ribosome-associated translation inhibitor RaiA [Anaerolineales bacterium]|nr:MAG: ribosome-associated translation inhibitor RaiA [Anaerolineales bacterium]
MQLIIKGKNMEITDSLREYVQRKLSKLGRHLPTIDEVRVELSTESVKSKDRQVVQVTMRSNSTILRAEERSADILAAIDAVRDKLQRQIKRYKEKPIRMRERAQAAAERVESELEEVAPRIVRTKRFVLRPMSEEEAIEQMELVGHDFFVFYNSTADAINVLYRRRDGNYGLLQPELG